MKKMTPAMIVGDKGSTQRILDSLVSKKVNTAVTRAPSIKYLMKALNMTQEQATKLLGGK